MRGRARSPRLPAGGSPCRDTVLSGLGLPFSRLPKEAGTLSLPSAEGAKMLAEGRQEAAVKERVLGRAAAPTGHSLHSAPPPRPPTAWPTTSGLGPRVGGPGPPGLWRLLHRPSPGASARRLGLRPRPLHLPRTVTNEAW